MGGRQYEYVMCERSYGARPENRKYAKKDQIC